MSVPATAFTPSATLPSAAPCGCTPWERSAPRFSLPNKFPSFRLGEKAQEVDVKTFDVQFPINPGDSGGPIVTDQCQLVGVNSSGQGRDLTHCIDVSEVRAFVRDGPSRGRLSSDTALSPTEARAAALRSQGMALLQQGDYQGAVTRLTKAIALNPAFPGPQRGAAWPTPGSKRTPRPSATSPRPWR